MQKLGRLLALIIILALGVGPFAPMHGAPASLLDAAMAADMHGAISGTDGASDPCGSCVQNPGMTQECLPSCITLPALAPQQELRLATGSARYEPMRLHVLSGAPSRPDPYPPRSILLV